MKKLIVLMFFCVSCNDTTTYKTQISFKNNLSNTITVQLFPKKEFSSFDMYRYENGSYRLNKFQILSGEDYDIISKPKKGQTPIELINERFDSLEIYTNTKVLKFKAQKVENYKSNLFEDLSSWNYKKNEREFPTQFKRNTVIFDDYYFNVDSLKIEN